MCSSTTADLLDLSEDLDLFLSEIAGSCSPAVKLGYAEVMLAALLLGGEDEANVRGQLAAWHMENSERLTLLAEARATARSLNTRGGVPGQAARGLEATNSLVQPA